MTEERGNQVQYVQNNADDRSLLIAFFALLLEWEQQDRQNKEEKRIDCVKK